MSSAVLEEILEEAKALPPEEQRQLKGVLNDENLKGVIGLLLAFGLIHLLEKRNALSHDERRRLDDLLNKAALDSGLINKADSVRALRGRYAHLPTNSEAFAAQKQEEIKLEDRK